MTYPTFEGFPLVAPDEVVDAAAGDLARTWNAQLGRPRRAIEEDLEALAVWFDPKARGERLRRQLDLLPESRIAPTLGEPFILAVSSDQWVVTPEGRALWELAASATRHAGTTQMSATTAAELTSTLLAQYRRWSQQRLRDVVGLRSGDGSPMLPQALGAAILLLGCGAIGAEYAVRVPSGNEDRSALDEAQSRAVEAFADTLSPPSSGRSRNRTMFSLRSGYGLTEARRRLGADLVLDATNNRVFIREGAEGSVVGRIGQELARRPSSELNRLDAALGAMKSELEAGRQVLASFNSGRYGPARFDSLRRQLIEIASGAAK